MPLLLKTMKIGVELVTEHPGEVFHYSLKTTVITVAILEWRREGTWVEVELQSRDHSLQQETYNGRGRSDGFDSSKTYVLKIQEVVSAGQQAGMEQLIVPSASKLIVTSVANNSQRQQDTRLQFLIHSVEGSDGHSQLTQWLNCRVDPSLRRHLHQLQSHLHQWAQDHYQRRYWVLVSRDKYSRKNMEPG